jgi:hypothetical protein
MNDSAIPHSLDTFAETNPAFCSLILSACASAYMDVGERPISITLIPLVLPIVMSGDLDQSFLHTTEKTGLVRWISRTPAVLFDLPERIEAGFESTRESLQFALHYHLLALDEQACISDLIGGDAIIRLKKLGFERMGANARRLGAWLAMLGSDTVAFNLLGLEV